LACALKVVSADEPPTWVVMAGQIFRQPAISDRWVPIFAGIVAKNVVAQT
jgi:hypothetical protein